MKKLIVAMLCAGIVSPATILAAPARKPVKAAAAPKASPVLPSALVVPPAPVIPEPVKGPSMAGITEYRLVNGMRVLLLPDASKPLIATNLVYLVGSRHEGYGQTGMAHLLEHMTFLRTTNYGTAPNSRRPNEVLASMGGQSNGFTRYDSTNYIATFPASPENLRQVLELEADRMLNATIRQEDLWNPAENRGEMSVVRNEFERAESNPSQVLQRRVRALAYDWHNYGKSVGGALTDIENVSAEALRQFYRTYYQPDNAVLVIAGQFDEAAALKEINRIFGSMPKPARVLSQTYTAEAVQDGERSGVVRRAAGAAMVAVGYHLPPAAHPDTVALGVLEAILTEPPTGRLSKAVAAIRQGVSLSVGSAPTKEASYGIFVANLPKEGDLEPVQAALLREIEGLKDKPVTDEEVDRVRRAAKASLQRIRSQATSVPTLLTNAIANGDWRMFFWQMDLLDKLDAKVVQAAAVKYFKPANRTVVRFLPTDTPDRADIPARFDLAAALEGFKGPDAIAAVESFDTSPMQVESRIQYFSLPNGMKGALLAKPTNGEAVNVVIRLRMGTEKNLWRKARIAALTASSLQFGTQRLNRQQLKEAFEQAGTRVQVIPSGPQAVTLTLTSNRSNVAAALDLAAEMLKTPALSDGIINGVRNNFVNALERSAAEPDFQASFAYRQLMNTVQEGHPHHPAPVAQLVAEAKQVSSDEVRAFHRAYYGAANASISVVGDFDAPALQEQVGKLFGDWKAELPYQRIGNSTIKDKAERQVVQTPDKQNSALNAGLWIPMGESHPDYAAMVIVDHLLGGPKASRLRNRIRTHEGLSYSVTSDLSASAHEERASWMVKAISAPHNLARVEALIREELARAAKDGFSEAEVAEAKKSWQQRQETSRATDSALAFMLTENLALSRTMAYRSDLEAKVAAVTPAAVTAAMRKYVDPARLSVAMAGDFAKAANQAQAVGAK